MGAKAKQPTRVRRKKSASAKISARKQHRFFPDSIPPGMKAEVFDVSRIDEDGLEVLDDEEVVPDSSNAPPASLRPPSLRPPSAPHPPRPSIRPQPLAPDDVHIDTPLSYASNPAAVLISLPPAPVVVPPKASGSGRTLFLLMGAALLALGAGLVLGRSEPSPAAAHTRQTSPVALPPAEGASDGRFAEARARAAIDAAVLRAKACRDANAPNGPLGVRLTFAQTGRVVGIDVAKPFAETAAGACFAAELRDVHVPAFEGALAVVERTVELPLP